MKISFPALLAILVCGLLLSVSFYEIRNIAHKREEMLLKFPIGSTVCHKIGGIKGIVLDASAHCVYVRFVSPTAGPQSPVNCTADELILESEKS